MLRLPHVRELPLLEPVRLQLRPFPDRRVRRSLLLPLSVLRRYASRLHPPVPPRAAVHLQRPAGLRRVHHARAPASRERRPPPPGGGARPGTLVDHIPAPYPAAP